MKRSFSFLMATIVVASLAILACTQSAPAPSPTKSLTAQTQSPQPTRASAAPTSAPAQKMTFPEKGRVITVIVPWDPGGATDIGVRLTTPLLEKELGVPIQVVNKPGANTQVGLTEFVTSKPDGYTLAATNLPNTFLTYIDPERKAVYSRKDFVAVAGQIWDPGAIDVKAESPYKTLKDLVDAARARPKQLKVSTTGLMNNTHIELLALGKAAGVQFTPVHFNGAPAVIAALLGDHVDAASMPAGNLTNDVKAGKIRVLGIYDKKRSRFLPDVPLMSEQGYNLVHGVLRGYSVPARTPKEIVNVLSSAFKRVLDNQDLRKKLDDMGLEQWFMDGEQFGAMWDEWEVSEKPLLDEAKLEAAK